MIRENNNIRDEALRIVKSIPRGKVSTYGNIAKQVQKVYPEQKVNPRYVGHILHANSDPAGVPCHRVVNSRGAVADNYAFGGWKKQKEKLIEEGLEFVGVKNVDLNKFLHLP